MVQASLEGERYACQDRLRSKTGEGEDAADHRNMQSAKYSKLEEHEMHHALGEDS
jgi:hypothetical protein